MESQTNIIDIQFVVRAVRQNIGWVISSCVLTVLFALVFSLVKDESYDATTMLIVDILDPGSNGANVPAMLQEDYMETQLGIIQSKFLANKVIQELQLEADSEYQQEYQSLNAEISYRAWLTQKLLNDLSAFVYNKSTRLIKIRYTANSAEKAIEYADTFAQLYIETMLDLNLSPIRNSAKWLEVQLVPLRKELESAEFTLADYQQRHNIFTTATNTSSFDEKRLTQLNTHLITTQNQIKTLKSQLTQLDETKSLSNLDSIPLIQNNDYLQKIRTNMREKQSQSADISKLYGQSHPDYISYTLEIKELKQKYAKEIENITVAERLKLQALLDEEKQLLSEIAQQENKVMSQQEFNGALLILEREVESARMNYKQAIEQYQQYALKSSSNQTNLTLLNTADLDLVKNTVSLRQILPLALLVGLLIGLLAAVFRAKLAELKTT